MFCPQCGTDTTHASYCPRCGTAVNAGPPSAQPQGVASVQPTAPDVPPPGGPARGGSAWPIVVGVVAGLLILGVTGILALLVVRSDSGDSRGTATTAAASAAGGSTAPSAAPDEKPRTKTPKPRAQQEARSHPGSVAALPAGLFCRDLNARGYSYVAAVSYWRLHGSPNQMDADRNGIPCETVYPASDVSAYWSQRDAPPAFTNGAVGLPSGLFCRDLYARGVSYSGAVSYWWAEGAPDRMDADLNGIPCETVYPASQVADFWW